MPRKPKSLVPRKSNAVRYGALVEAMCRDHGLPLPRPEWPVCSGRRWRYDFAWIEQKVALEIQGGLFVSGRHTRGAALLKEHEKLNTAAALGWRVLFATPGTFLLSVPQLVEAIRGIQIREI